VINSGDFVAFENQATYDALIQAEAGSPAVSGRTARREAVSAAFATAKKRRFPALLLAAALPLTPAGKSHRRSLP